MNLSNFLRALFEMGESVRDTTLPGWRNRRHVRPKKRTQGRGAGRPIGEPQANRMQVEAFLEHDKRNERFAQLRKQGTPDVVKWSSSAEGRCVWFVAHN